MNADTMQSTIAEREVTESRLTKLSLSSSAYTATPEISLDVRLAAMKREPELYKIVQLVETANGFTAEEVGIYHTALIGICLSSVAEKKKIRKEGFDFWIELHNKLMDNIEGAAYE